MSKETWLKRENETPRMYELFQFFLSLPIEKRTSGAVAKNFGVSSRYIEQVRERNDWTQRAADFQNSQTAAIQKGATRAAEKVAFDWATWDLENLERIRQTCDSLFQKTTEILQLPVVRKETKENVVIDPESGEPLKDKNGKTVYQSVTIHNPMKFTGSDAAKFAEAAILMSNYVIERSKGLTPRRINEHLPLPPKDLDEMNDDELAEYAEQCRRASESIAKGENLEISELEQ